MHEWGLACSLVEEAARAAKARGALRVTAVTASVGSLAGVVPELLQRAYEVARAGSPLEGAPLRVEVEQARARCPRCRCESEFEDYALVCPSCGGVGLEVLSGTRILLRSVEMEVDDDGDPPDGGNHV